MHEAIRNYVRREIEAITLFHKTPLSVLEFGGRDVNGNIRDLLPPMASYLCVDILPGPNVDIVADASTWETIDRFNLILCLGTIEHTPKAREICANAYRLLATGGAFLLSTVGPTFPYHSAINDPPLGQGENEYYRTYTTGEVEGLLSDFEVKRVVLLAGDILAYAIKTSGMLHQF